MSETVAESDVIRAAQAVQRDRRGLLALLSDVADSVVAQDQEGGAVVHLSASLLTEIQRRTTRGN